MDYETTQYEFSHERKPRGYGQWCFAVTGSNGNGSYTTERYWLQGYYAQQKVEAARRLKRDCAAVKYVVSVEVLP